MRTIRLTAALLAIVVAACAGAPATPATRPRAPAPAPPAATAAPPASSVAPLAAPLARPSLPTTIGDVTCSADADCTTTTRADCCDCCASNARATSTAWLAWRDGTECPKTRCEPCGKVKCPFFGDPATLRAVCIGGACALVPADEPD